MVKRVTDLRTWLPLTERYAATPGGGRPGAWPPWMVPPPSQVQCAAGGEPSREEVPMAIQLACRGQEPLPAEWKDACMHAIYKGRGSRTSVDATWALLSSMNTPPPLTPATSAWTWRSGCMMHINASIEAPQSASTTSAGW